MAGRGKKTGVWVDGISLEEILAANPKLKGDDLENVMRGVHAFSEFLQEFQNEMVRLVREGASDAQLTSFAQNAMATGNLTLTNKDLNDGVEGDIAKYLPGLIYQKFLSTPLNKMKDFFKSFRSGDGIDNKNRAEAAFNNMDWSDRFDAGRSAAKLEDFNPENNVNKAHNDGARIVQSYRDEIEAMPPELQAEAWKIANDELERAVSAAGEDQSDSLPEVPEYQRDHMDYGTGNKDRKARDRSNERSQLYDRIYA